MIGVLALCLGDKAGDEPESVSMLEQCGGDRVRASWTHLPIESSSLQGAVNPSCVLDWWCSHSGVGKNEENYSLRKMLRPTRKVDQCGRWIPGRYPRAYTPRTRLPSLRKEVPLS